MGELKQELWKLHTRYDTLYGHHKTITKELNKLHMNNKSVEVIKMSLDPKNAEWMYILVKIVVPH